MTTEDDCFFFGAVFDIASSSDPLENVTGGWDRVTGERDHFGLL